MRALTASLLFAVVGLAGCASPPPPPQQGYEAAPTLDPGAEYPRTHTPRAQYGQPAS